MARNRKRAKERRARRPESVAARSQLEPDVPASIRHSAPDVELAEAQLALGRPELADGEPEPEPLTDEEFEEVSGGSRADEEADGRSFGGGRGGSGSEEIAAPGAAAPAERAGLITRFVHFLQGSWRELHRVQWPDRRQVMQATGVVIGFVIVAGVFLGVADTLSTHVMNLVLTGKW